MGSFVLIRGKRRGPRVMLPGKRPASGNAGLAIVSIKAGGPGSGRRPYGSLKPALSLDDAKKLTDPSWYRHHDWKKQAYGGVIVNHKGEFLLRKPSGHYDGYVWTWPKGKMDNENEHPVDVANREVEQETGFKAGITDQLPYTYTSGSGSFTNFYLMRPQGFDPTRMDEETSGLKWANYEQAKQLISQTYNPGGKARDLTILEVAHNHLSKNKMAAAGGWTEELHPRGPGGKFIPSGGFQNKKEAHSFLTKSGWKYTGMSSPGIVKSLKKTYEHPQFGKMWVGNQHLYHMPNLGGTVSTFKDVIKDAPVGKPAMGGKDISMPVVPVASKIPDTFGLTPKPVGMPDAFYHPATNEKFSYSTGTGTYVNDITDPVYKSLTVDEADKLLSTPKPAAELAKNIGSEMPPAIKGPKGGVYKYNPETQMYEHPAGYTISPQKAAQLVKSGSYKEHDPNAAPVTKGGAKASLAAKIPEGMYSEYTKKSGPSTFHVKYNETSGMYEKWKGAKTAWKGVQTFTPAQAQGNMDKNGGYVPKKGAVGGTGPKVTPEIKPSVLGVTPTLPPPAPPKAEFTYKNDGYDPSTGSKLKGAHDKYIFSDKSGNDWLFKPATTLSGEKSPLMAHAAAVTSTIQQAIRPDAAIPVKTTTVDIPGKGENFGSMQKMLSNVAPNKDFGGTHPVDLKPSEIKGLQQEQVVDWLTSNHDSHGAQFLRTGDDKVVGIDKDQAFKYFPDDKLSITYKPNTEKYGEKEPYYNTLWNAVKSEAVTANPNDVLPAIKKAQDIPDDKYKAMLKPYADARYGAADSSAKDQFYNQAVGRKNSLKDDFEKFYSGIFGKDFKFDTSTLYSAKPEKISQEAHEALEDAGYKFQKYGAKTGNPLYVDKDNKAVYVTDPKTNAFEYYPMGTHGTNPYGSSKGAGIENLKSKIVEPFEKPETPAYSAPAASYKSYGLSPALQAKFAELPEKPYNPANSGKSTSFVTSTGNLTKSEESVLGSYKGSGYISINGFLYGNKGTQSEQDIAKDYKIKNLDSALDKNHLNKDVTLWRGTGSSYANQLKEWFLQGYDIHVPESYQSTATSQSFAHGWGAGDVIFQIHAKAGHPAYAWGSESEIMLSRHTVYKVNELFKSGGKLYVDVNAEYQPGAKQAKKISGMAKKKSVRDILTEVKPLTEEEYARRLSHFKDADEAELGMSIVINSKTGQRQTGVMAVLKNRKRK